MRAFCVMSWYSVDPLRDFDAGVSYPIEGGLYGYWVGIHPEASWDSSTRENNAVWVNAHEFGRYFMYDYTERDKLDQSEDTVVQCLIGGDAAMTDEQKKNRREVNQRWKEQNTLCFGVRLNRQTDADIIAKLEGAASRQGELKRLVRMGIKAEEVKPS